LSGYPPFRGKTDDEIVAKVKQGRFSLNAVEWKHASSEVKSLIKKMLTYDPIMRPSAAEILKEPWFNIHNYSNQGMGRLITFDCINNLRSFCVRIYNKAN
jgi:calcium-dependent protein kinase